MRIDAMALQEDDNANAVNAHLLIAVWAHTPEVIKETGGPAPLMDANYSICMN